MKILLTYYFRVIKKNRLSFALILLSLCLVSATVYINLNIDSDVFYNCEKQMDSIYHGFDASLEINDVEKALPADVDVPGADRTIAFYLDYASCQLGDSSSAFAFWVRTDLDTVAGNRFLSLSEGTMPSTENEVLITQNKAMALSLSVGDSIFLNNTELTVTGLVSDASVFETDFPNVLEVFGTLSSESRCNFFLLDYSCDVDTLLASVPLSIEDYSFSVFEMDTAHKTEEMKIIFGFILVMIGIIASFVIYSSLTMIIGSQEKAMATFISVGACKKKITALLLGEGVIEGLVGGVFGLFTGELFRYFIYHFYLAGDGYVSFASPIFLCIAFGFTFFLQIGITCLSVFHFHSRTGKDNLLKIEKEKPLCYKFFPYGGVTLIGIALLLYFVNASKNLSLLFLSMGSFFIGFVLTFPVVIRHLFAELGQAFRRRNCGVPYLACNSLSREKINVRNALLTTLVLSLSFVSIFISSSMNDFFSKYWERYNYDILVRGTNGYAVTADDCELVLQYADEVEYIVKEYYEIEKSTLNGKKIDRKVWYIMENEDLGGMNYLDFDIHTDSLETGECLMDELMARHYGFAIGDEITIHFLAAENDTQDFTVTVIGYCDSSIFNDDRETIVLSVEDYLTHVTNSIRKTGLVLKDDVSVSEFLAKFKYLSYSVMPSKYLKIEDVTQYVQGQYDEVARIITLLSFIPVFVTLLSVLGLVNNELVLFAEKKKSYAVLASTCINKKKLCFLIFTELLLMFLTGIVFALLFDSFFIFLIRDVLYVLFTYTEISLSLGSILGLTGITFLILGFGFLFFARQTMKMDVVKEIRYE